ncbi:MAG: protein kinase [Candidatus Rokubacteria bacterium]|nr:protein kinase [Candidatus Rokubacteria bacterium]
MMIGARLSHFSIVEKIGEGGMGVVYRATDNKLRRDVAIKILPDAFASDPERLARFEQEARVLAVLNHPNIAAVYGLEESDGVRFLVMELVPGETLGGRIAKGQLPVGEALQVCRQMAEALEAAHEKGIIHRDLKPANVKVTPDGTVKVLDFGLAKAFAPEQTAADVSQSPTATYWGSSEGVILGTAAYMSPEQARGKPVDRRTDIWSFGCVLYEALTRKQAFAGETVSDTIARILEREPDWSALPEAVPEAVVALLRRCLIKDARQRLRDIGDARIEIDAAVSGAPGLSTTGAATRRPSRQRFGTSKVGLSLLLLGAGLAGAAVKLILEPTGERPGGAVLRFRLDFPASAPLAATDQNAVSISPDGRAVVYVARGEESTRLYLRRMDRLEAEPLAGTEGAEGPFFSPDGEWVGFFARGELKKVALSGGGVMEICDARNPRGASWGPDGTILFAAFPASPGIRKVAATGGTPESVAGSEEDSLPRWPELLPDGKSFLLNNRFSGAFSDARIGVRSMDGSHRRALPHPGTHPKYAVSGHLVFARGGVLLAAPFDASRPEEIGAALPVLEGVMMVPITGAAHYAFSRNGSLVYVPGPGTGYPQSLVWLERSGAVRAILARKGGFQSARVSPDGHRIALAMREETSDIWVYDLERETLSRVTFSGNSYGPVWSVDGKSIAYNSLTSEGFKVILQRVDENTPAEVLYSSPSLVLPQTWSHDGQSLLLTVLNTATGMDIWLVAVDEEHRATPLLQSAFNETGASISPDGRWVAYQSDESGNPEVYVQPFPALGSKWQISSGGGTRPVWAPNGRELFYASDRSVMRVTITTTPGFQPSKPVLLFDIGTESTLTGPLSMTPDGQRFVALLQDRAATPTHMVVVLNWFEELKRLVPGGR